jgi:ribonuclease P protein component
MSDQSFNKAEKLCSTKILDALFTKGKAVQSGRVRLLWMETQLNSEVPVQAAFAVPKRNFKHAVDRNYIKRILRECYRKEKGLFLENTIQQHKQLAMVWIYQSKEKPDYTYITTHIAKIIQKITASLTPHDQ